LNRASSGHLADLALLAVAAVWGLTFVVIKESLAHVGPLTFVAMRFALAAAVLGPIAARRLRLRGLPHGVLAGLALLSGYLLQTAGLQFTSAARAGFITGLSVVLVPALGALLLRAPITTWVGLGVALATAGLALLSLESVDGLNVGDLLVLGCALGFAGHILLLARFAPGQDPLALTATQIATAGALSALAVPIFEPIALDKVSAALPAAALTGLFATALAYAVQTAAQRATPPTHTALIFSTEPVFAALFAFLLAGERLAPPQVFGATLILAGMLVVQLEPRRLTLPD
jgi:drug/metabolite transporter (DMT)-like permease